MTARAERLIALLALLFLSLFALREMTPSPAIKDASETLRMALNLQRHGIISIDDAEPYRASMMREPVPIVTTAVALDLVDEVIGAAEPSEYFSGARVRYLKFQNLLWLWVLCVSVFTAVRQFTASFWLGLLGAAMAVSPFTWFIPAGLKMYIGVDSLDTDMAGAALLSAATMLLSLGVTRRDFVMSAAASLCFGVLALTKAAIFYVYPGVLCVIGVYLAVHGRFGRGNAARSGQVTPGSAVHYAKVAVGASLAIPFMLVTSAWLIRNYADTGFFAIAERGGPVLLYRAFLDDVTPEEYVGAFSVWGGPYSRRLAGDVTGLGDEDLAAGGRLQRLAMQFSGQAQERELQGEELGKPGQTVSWYRKSRAIYNEQLAKYAAEGQRYPSGAADQATRNEAIRLIVGRPIKHALLMIPLLWRGALMTFPLLVITLIYAWKQDRADLMVYVLPALVLVVFYAAATHFSERYGYVSAAEASTCFLVLASLASSRWFTRRRAS